MIFSSSYRYILLFIPWDKIGPRERDGVRQFYKLLSFRNKVLNKVHLEDNFVHHSFQAFLDTEKALDPCKSLFLFAHPHHSLKGFAINSHGQPGDVILAAAWWNCDERPEVLLAHVCSGSEILRGSEWRTKFARWVTFNKNIDIFIATRLGRKRWKHLLNTLIREVGRNSDLSMLKTSVERVYEDTMMWIQDTSNGKGGDTLNLICMERCIQSLTTSED